MVAKATILAELAKCGQLNVLDYPIELSETDDSYTDGTGLFIGQFREFQFKDIFPIIMHEYYHCRLMHFQRVEKAKTPLLQFLHNISMDIEINEYLLTKGITSEYFQETGQFKKRNALNIEIPANLHTFEEILAYLMRKLPQQKFEALNQLSSDDFKKLGADLMGAPGEVKPNVCDFDLKPEEELSSEERDKAFEQSSITDCDPDDLIEKEAGTTASEMMEQFSRYGIERDVKLSPEKVGQYKISWSRLLLKFAGKLKGRVLGRTYQRPRRSGDYGRTILPAFRNMEGALANLDVYIDVSGSMYRRDLKRFVETQRSLRQLSTETRISYFTFNEKVYPIKYNELPTMMTGGGTKFEEMLEQILKRKNPTIIFTDMCTSEGDLTKLQELQDKILVLTVNDNYKDRKDLPYVVYVR